MSLYSFYPSCRCPAMLNISVFWFAKQIAVLVVELQCHKKIKTASVLTVFLNVLYNIKTKKVTTGHQLQNVQKYPRVASAG